MKPGRGTVFACFGVVAVIVTGCGRIGFDANDGDGGGSAGGDMGPRGDGLTTCSSTIKQVQVGDITIAANSTQASAPLTPIQTNASILWTSLRQNEGSPQYGTVRCYLAASSVTCDRPLAGTDTTGSTGVTVVRYYVAEFSQGVNVQRGVIPDNTSPSTIGIQSIDPTSSFVLLGGEYGGTSGTGWGADEFVRYSLAADTVTLVSNDGTEQEAWQVVSMAGAHVTRGAATIQAASSMTTAPVVTETDGTFVLFAYNTAASAGSPGEVMVAGSLSNATTLSLQRGQPAASSIDVQFEVITVPFVVRSGVATIPDGQATTIVSMPSISPSTSVAFASNQAVLGQSGGSSTFTTDDVPGAASATLQIIAADMLQVTRSRTTGDAVVPWFVVDFGTARCP